MDKRIIYTKPDGGVAVIIPADCGLTVEQIAAKDVPAGAEFKIVDVSEIPADRTFRAAWESGANGVVVNVDKARIVAHDARRAKRAADFAPLDDAIAKQLPGFDIAEVEGQRHDVRVKYEKAQADIDKAGTVEEIKAVISGL